MSDPDSKPRKIGWLEVWKSGHLRSPSVIILIVANLVPLYGVLFWGWDLFTLMVAYWMETAAIGFWNIVHMALLARWFALFMVPFFIVHFGGFMLGHFLFLWQMFGGGWNENVESVAAFLRSIPVGWGVWIAFAALFISHGLSFLFNAFRPWWRGDVERHDQNAAQRVMMGTYGRVMVMHFTLLFGAALVAYFETPAAAFVLLIVLKILVDVPAHVRKNFKPAEGRGPRMRTA
jgi:hypothetical protein